MIQRRTQTADYWQEHFALTDEDVGYLYSLVLDAGRPFYTAELAQKVIERHCRQEESIIQAELSKGPVYQPRDVYEVGQQIIFPLFGYVLGTVVDIREGRNPDYGEFPVIRVDFEDDDIREFASGLHGEHKLNRQEEEGELLEMAELLPAAELYEQYGELVEDALHSDLVAHGDFTRFGDEWFLQDLLAEVQTGHLNIAEALIEIKSMPLPTVELLPDLDLPAELPAEIQALSLNCALEADPRFDNVGDGGRDIWYLRSMTPEPVVNPPERLLLGDEPYERGDIAEELLLIEREIDDEGSSEGVMGPSRPIYRTSIGLTYHHWRCGTLPLTVRTRGLFPTATNHHTPVVLVDAQSGNKMQGWVVHESSFVYGLADWFKRYRLPVGAYIKLDRTRDPRIITVDFEARRLKHLWGKVAVAHGGELEFQVRKLPISCDYDEQLTVSEDNPKEIDVLWARTAARKESLVQIMVRLMPGLVKLSPQGTVHAKTIYSAVNILRRAAPGPVFVRLSTEPCFVSMGGGYWAFDETLVRP